MQGTTLLKQTLYSSHFIRHLLHSAFLPEHENLAFGKPAWQSSNHTVPWSSGAAVDGNMNSNFLNCTHTSDEVGAWWVIDLQSKYVITKVVILFGITHQGKIYYL